MTVMETAILGAMGSEPTPASVLYQEATGELPVDADRAIWVHISNIRHKLAEVGLDRAIVTVRGQGYVWAPEGYTRPRKPLGVRWEECTYCGVTFSQPREQRKPFAYCTEHRNHKYRQRVWWRRRTA